jgi:FlaA1/EpsC-like NDP-sugar epimerase
MYCVPSSIKKINNFFKDHMISKKRIEQQCVFKEKTIMIVGGAGSVVPDFSRLLSTFVIMKLIIHNIWEYSILRLQQSFSQDRRKKTTMHFFSFLTQLAIEKIIKLPKSQKFEELHTSFLQ